MKLERGFRLVIDACAVDTQAFLGLINKGSDYMRSLLTI
jgi:hypothetical protein